MSLKPQLRLCSTAGLIAALLAAGHAHAGVRIGGVDASDYPTIEATVVGTTASTRAPSVSADGEPVAGLVAQNLGRE
jgi:hypothetical protein